MFEHSIMKYI